MNELLNAKIAILGIILIYQRKKHKKMVKKNKFYINKLTKINKKMVSIKSSYLCQKNQ